MRSSSRDTANLPTMFLKVFSSVVLVFFFILGLFNLVIDPYGAFAMPRVEGFNANKPEFQKHVRLGKAGIVRSLQPKGVILGSSRAEFGLDPQHPGWRTTPTYNLGIPGPNTYELRRFFGHANAIRRLERVVIGLDQFQFNVYRPNQKDFEDSILKRDRLGGFVFPFRFVLGSLQMLVSADMFASSFRTLEFQGEESVYLQDGSRNQERIRSLHHPLGFRVSFQDQARIAAEAYGRKFGMRNPETGENSVENFRHILEIAHRDSIDLHLFTSRPHAWALENFDTFRDWSEREEWMRQVVAVNEETAEMLNVQAFPLWDFSGYSKYTTERVPDFADATPMQWYFEGFHYTQALGDLILDRMFDYSDASRVIADNFGVRLRSEDLDLHFAKTRAAQRKYRVSHGVELAELAEFRNVPEAVERH
jgi:hypothetical protein